MSTNEPQRMYEIDVRNMKEEVWDTEPSRPLMKVGTQAELARHIARMTPLVPGDTLTVIVSYPPAAFAFGEAES